MKEDNLVIGDVILIKNGHNVNVSGVPSKFFISNRRFSSETRNEDVVIGHLYKLDVDIAKSLKCIAQRIIEAFSYEGVKLPVADAVQFATGHIDIPKSETFIVKGGEFVIIDTKMEGGGSAMGNHDYYPDALRVYCKKLHADGTYNPDGQEIKFYYKSRSHSSGITETIKPIGTLKKEVTFK